MFGLVKSEKFRESSLFSVLEWVVIIGVGVTIAAELLGIIWAIKSAIKEYKTFRSQEKNKEKAPQQEQILTKIPGI